MNALRKISLHVPRALESRDLQQSTSNAANLHLDQDVRLNIGKLGIGEVFGAEAMLEVLRVEGAADEALVDAAGRAYEAEREDGEL